MAEIIKPVIKLNKEQTAQLKGSKQEIAAVKHAMANLKKIGMDVKMLEDKLRWAEEVQDVLLKEFT